MNPTTDNPNGIITVDTRCGPVWVEKVRFRSPDVRLRGKRQSAQKTTGDKYASKAYKAAHPEFWWEGAAKKGGKAHKRIVRKGKTVKKMVVGR